MAAGLIQSSAKRVGTEFEVRSKSDQKSERQECKQGRTSHSSIGVQTARYGHMTVFGKFILGSVLPSSE